MNANIKVPFDSRGNHTTQAWYNGTLVPNFTFSAGLIFTGYCISASSVHVNWKDVNTGITYVSTMDLLQDNLLSAEHVGFVKGVFCINGTFTFTKRGTSVFLIRE